MDYDVRSWCDPHFEQRRLPKEEEIQDFFNCINTEERPYEESFFKAVLNHDYSAPDNNNYYSRNTGKYPVLYPDNYTSNWIAASLMNMDSPLSLGRNSLLGTDGYSGETEEQRKISSLGMRLDPLIRADIVLAHDSKCLSYDRVVKSCKDMSSILHRIKNFVSNIQQHEIEQFKKGLSLGKYIKTLSHTDILGKIEKLRNIYPLEPIYVLAKEPLLDYLYVHCPITPGQLAPNVWLVLENSTNRYSYRNVEDEFDNYKSAIFTLNEMKGSHKFRLYYEYLRGNRQWHIYLSILGEIGFDIGKDITESSQKENLTKPNHPRWGTLFI